MKQNPNSRANLKLWKKGQSGNPAGKPKGARHLSTWIQELLNDEGFEAQILDGYTITKYKGAPIKAIIGVAIKKSLAGDQRWADWLAKHGYGTRHIIDVDDPIDALLEAYGITKAVADDRKNTETI